MKILRRKNKVISRRSFIKTSTFTAASAALLGGSNLAFGKNTLKTIGVQLYTVRNEMQKDFDGTLKTVAALGYKEFEFAGYNNRSPKDVRSLIDGLGVTAPSAHFPMADFAKDTGKIIDTAKILGHSIVVLPFLMPNERKTLDDYKKLTAILNKSGEACKKAGIQMAYHNHDFEFKELEGKLPMDVILAETDKNLVKIEMDLGWISYAGKDPVEYFKKHPGRVVNVHVKDMDAKTKQITVEIGKGNVDFRRIFAAAKTGGVKHFFVEQDNTSIGALESLKVSMAALKKLEY